MNEPTDFGDFLFRCVRRRGLSMATFAERAGVSASTLSRVRNGRRRPREEQIEAWAELLELAGEEAARFRDLGLMARAPADLRRRLADSEARIREERDRHEALRNDYAEFRKANSFYDGYWLAYNYAFRGDGSVLRSLARIAGGAVEWRNVEEGLVQYSYHGSLEVLGEKVFVQMREDRGDVEQVQVIMHALFDFREPTFLYGLISGISGKSPRHPDSRPVAARMLMLHLGREEELVGDPEFLESVEATLGTFDPERIAPFFRGEPARAERLRSCLGLRPREDLDAVILGLIDNRLEPGRSVLDAKLGG